MEIVYLGISSKYIHTMPAGWFLSEYLGSRGIKVRELYYNVNQPIDAVIGDLSQLDIRALLISVYIFNVDYVKELIRRIRSIKPTIQVIIGGPEADESIAPDYMIIGEGEEALFRLLTLGSNEKVIKGLRVESLDSLPSPYTQERLANASNKLIYYESSRGCPFHCSYCMAAKDNRVRYFSLERVKSDLKTIVASGAKIIKFTDRTFNINKQRTIDILRYIGEEYTGRGICFHFEVGGDLFDDEVINILNGLEKGLVQLEAGVQTLNPTSLQAVNRVFDRQKFIDNMSRIIQPRNVHVHLDLIAGLPNDTLDSFKDSFNAVMRLSADMLQLGFLKMLKGTPIRDNYSAIYQEDAPYEIISTPHMSSQDLLELKGVEFITDRLYNSGKFSSTLNKLLENSDYYELFNNLSQFFTANGVGKQAQEERIYEAILEYLKDYPWAKDYLRFDYLITNNSRVIPKCLKINYSEIFKQFLKKKQKSMNLFCQEFTYLPELIEGHYYVEFDYSIKDRVTGKYSYRIVEE